MRCVFTARPEDLRVIRDTGSTREDDKLPCARRLAPQPDGLVGRPYKLAVLALCLVNVAHFYSIASLFAYAGFLAVDNGWAEDEDSAGFVVGVLATMVPLSRIPTSALWGHAADRFGRKPALVATMASVLVGMYFIPSDQASSGATSAVA